MNLNLFLHGAIFAAAITASFIFFDFWKKTRDSLFCLFGFAFALLSGERLALAFLFSGDEYKVYFIRLAAFALIIVAIVQKNRPKKV